MAEGDSSRYCINSAKHLGQICHGANGVENWQTGRSSSKKKLDVFYIAEYMSVISHLRPWAQRFVIHIHVCIIYIYVYRYMCIYHLDWGEVHQDWGRDGWGDNSKACSTASQVRISSKSHLSSKTALAIYRRNGCTRPMDKILLLALIYTVSSWWPTQTLSKTIWPWKRN